MLGSPQLRLMCKGLTTLVEGLRANGLLGCRAMHRTHSKMPWSRTSRLPGKPLRCSPARQLRPRLAWLESTTKRVVWLEKGKGSLW